MAPKKKTPEEDVANMPPPPSKKKKSSDDPPDDSDKISRDDQKLFGTVMAKNDKAGVLSVDQAQARSKYKSMGRFDQDKKELIAQWKLDKSCKWIHHFTKVQEKSSVVENDIISGWGTRSAIFLFCL